MFKGWRQLETWQKILWLGLIVVWLVLLYLAIRPTGVAIYRVNDWSGTYFLHKFGPPERWATSSGGLVMIGEPGYFYVRPTRRFNQAEITIKWRKSSNVPLEVGVLVDRAHWQYITKPLNNPVLNNLHWPSLMNGSYCLWQRKPVYSSWQDFINNPPPASQLALYNFSWPLAITPKLDNYQAKANWQTLPGKWRGSQHLIVYVGPGESLAWRLTAVSDSVKPLTADEREIEVNIYGPDSTRIQSSRFSLEQEQVSQEIIIPSKVAAVYNIEIKASSKILFTLATKQSIFSWQNQVWPVFSPDFSWQMWTDVPELTAQTIQPTSCETINVGSQSLTIDSTYKQYHIITEDPVTEIKGRGGDIQFSGNGVFSLSSEVFNPYPRRVGRFLDKDPDINFVAANYEMPSCNEQICKASAVLPLKEAFWQPNDGYQFIIAVSGGQLSTSSPLTIEEIQVKLSGSNLWQAIEHKLQFLWLKLTR